MNDKIFEQLIRAERERPLPVCPSNLESDVLRRVHLASRDADKMGGLEWIFGLIPRAGVAFGALALTVLLRDRKSTRLNSSH